MALQYDTGDFHACMDKSKELAEVDGFAARKAATEAKGKLRGIGYSSYIEACGIAPSNIAGALGARAGLFECGEIRVHPTGSVTVFTGSHSHGQGHETTFAQVVAARLGIPVENVDVVHGDTGRVPFGMGTYGSRSISVGGSAIMKALDKIETKAKKIAAHLMEASDADIEFANGEFTVKGTDKKIPFGQVALTAYVPHNYPLDKLEPGLNETAFYDPTNFTFPGGTYICEVEIDKQTGEVKIDRFTAVRRLRHHHQPDDRRGAGARRPGAGHRPGADGAAASTTRDRPAAHRQLHGLRHAARRRLPRSSQLGDRLHALHPQPAGHQGLRRGRRDRLAAGGDQRRARRAARRWASRTSTCRPSPHRVWEAMEQARRPAQQQKGNTMYAFTFERPTTLADAVRLAQPAPSRWPAARPCWRR